ncbi:MAG TPA: hypothetical protein PLL88_06455 [Anaerolineaceae bacterium]|nr:hypothetical protein [Anaerolineaceae bacterium]
MESSFTGAQDDVGKRVALLQYVPEEEWKWRDSSVALLSRNDTFPALSIGKEAAMWCID